MKPGRIDAGLRVASADLTGGAIGPGIDSEVGGDRQSGEVHCIAFDHLVLPRRARDALDRAIILTALAKGCSERAWFHPQGSSYKPPIAGDVGDDRHIEALDVFEDHDRTAAGTLELEYGRSNVELALHGRGDPHQLVGVLALDHRQKTAHTLPVHRLFL